MKIKTMFVASFIIPLLLIACNRDDQQVPFGSGSGEDSQTMTPADPGMMRDNTPPAAGVAPAMPPVEPAPAMTKPATPPSEPAKSGY